MPALTRARVGVSFAPVQEIFPERGRSCQRCKSQDGYVVSNAATPLMVTPDYAITKNQSSLWQRMAREPSHPRARGCQALCKLLPT